MFCIRLPSRNENHNNNSNQAKINVSNHNEIEEQNDESNQIKTAIETNNTDDIQNNDTNQNQIESANDIKAVINPEIHNEIKLYIEKAHELTQENIGEDVSKDVNCPWIG